MTAALSPEVLLSPKEVCPLAGVKHPRTIRAKVSAGLFPPPDIRHGNRPRWKPSTIAKWQAKLERARKFAGAR
jgi:predicted DNA-binding transcriptional regulator AlpA